MNRHTLLVALAAVSTALMVLPGAAYDSEPLVPESPKSEQDCLLFEHVYRAYRERLLQDAKQKDDKCIADRQRIGMSYRNQTVSAPCSESVSISHKVACGLTEWEQKCAPIITELRVAQCRRHAAEAIEHAKKEAERVAKDKAVDTAAKEIGGERLQQTREKLQQSLNNVKELRDMVRQASNYSKLSDSQKLDLYRDIAKKLNEIGNLNSLSKKLTDSALDGISKMNKEALLNLDRQLQEFDQQMRPKSMDSGISIGNLESRLEVAEKKVEQADALYQIYQKELHNEKLADVRQTAEQAARQAEEMKRRIRADEERIRQQIEANRRAQAQADAAFFDDLLNVVSGTATAINSANSMRMQPNPSPSTYRTSPPPSYGGGGSGSGGGWCPGCSAIR